MDYYEPPEDLLMPYLEWIVNGYELNKLGQLSIGLAKEEELSRIQKTTYVESFIIHSRNMYDFFANERPPKNKKNPDKQDDTICARHYLPGWDLAKARENPVLKEYFGHGKAANRHAFHLSASRLQLTEDGPTVMKVMWPWPRITLELAGLWGKFSAARSPPAS